MKIVSINLCIYLTLTLGLSSCAWLSKLRSSDSEYTSASRNGKEVSNQQYNELLQKYDQLKRQGGVSTSDSTRRLVSDLGNVPGYREEHNEPVSLSTRQTSNQVVRSYNQSSASLADTVDVFAEDGPGTKEPSVVDLGKFNEPDRFPVSIDTEIKQFQTAQQAMKSGDAGQAMKLYKILEKSSNNQLKVRAKFNMAEILFDQKDYNLALKAYEEIIKSHAFSGFIIKSLGRVIVCAEKLNLKDKKDKYYSILHDFFERE